MYSRLGRTSEFLIYGHEQQRRAVIEAVRLFENGRSNKKLDSRVFGEESNGITSPQYFKDMSKKWQQFVTRVSNLSDLLFIYLFLAFAG